MQGFDLGGARLLPRYPWPLISEFITSRSMPHSGVRAAHDATLFFMISTLDLEP